MNAIFIIFTIIGYPLHLTAGWQVELKELNYYEVVSPIHINQREKRDVSVKRDKKILNFAEIKFEVTGFNRTFVMKLKKNRILLQERIKFISQYEDGSRKIEKSKILEKCYYHGKLENRRTSMVTMSTCNGLRGLIQDEDEEEFFIEPYMDTHYIMYKMKDLKSSANSSCGHHHMDLYRSFHGVKVHLRDGANNYLRQRRDISVWNYIEMVVVVDHRLHKRWGSSVETSKDKALELMNFVDEVYKMIRTRVVVVGLIVWATNDEIDVSNSSSVTLNRFTDYTKNIIHGKMDLYNDNAQLLTGISFNEGIVGLGGISSICKLTSCAVNRYHSSNAAVSANTVAHELGHNLGFLHNGAGCSCSNSPCVMAAYLPGSQVKGFSSCTIKKYNSERSLGKYPCLHDYPSKRIGDIVCGDGYREGEEECDCGSPEDCKKSGADKCCNPTTCQLQENAECADGACCSNCTLKSKGALCRDRIQKDCDLEEYCTGDSNHCPRNYYITDGKSCENGQGYCYKGACKTHTQQCELLWGPDGLKGKDPCFRTNGNGNGYGNCGKNDETGEFIACSERDYFCGKIQCQPKPNTTLRTFPLLGSKRKIQILKFIGHNTVTTCKAIKMEFPKELEDPTLTFDGTKCGENSICIGQKCTKTSALPNIKTCDKECKNGGVCNNNGHCHCLNGFACPYCEYPGKGGSIDSGQGCYVPPTIPLTTTTTTSTVTATTTNTTTSTGNTTKTTSEPSITGENKKLVTVLVATIVPTLVILTFLVVVVCYHRNNILMKIRTNNHRKFSNKPHSVAFSNNNWKENMEHNKNDVDTNNKPTLSPVNTVDVLYY